MKKSISLFIMFFILSALSASHNIVSPKNVLEIYANKVFFPIGKNGELISLMQLSEMKIKEFETLRGSKLKFAEKLGFKIAQKRLRSSINADGSFNDNHIKKLAAKGDGSGFNAGGFLLGLLLGPIGLLIAYLINDEKKRVRVKSAWIGLAVFLALWLILIIAALSSFAVY